MLKVFSSDGYYIRPVPGILTQGPHGKNNSGLDMRAAVGTPVRAAARGEVIQVSRYRTSGLFVRIKHDNCTRTFYGHLSKQMVKVGDVVNQGQVIGLSGNTGRTTGPHLHFAVDSTRSQC
jgi:murein DD-endopeptidase MepM/ murein hydrolase activator NlpD